MHFSLTIEVFRDAKIASTVHTVENGEDALRFLFREPPIWKDPKLERRAERSPIW